MNNINLKSIRKKCGLKQCDLAEAMGITQQQYSRYETGTNKIPLEIFIRMLNVCECKCFIQIKEQQYEFKNI